jgi:hypothetical protein
MDYMSRRPTKNAQEGQQEAAQSNQEIRESSTEGDQESE